MFYQFTFERVLSLILVILATTSGVYLTQKTYQNLSQNQTITQKIDDLKNYPRYLVSLNDRRLALNNQSRVLGSTTGTSPSFRCAQDVPVLLYHGLITKPDGDNVLASDFRNQMETLKAGGYQTVTLQDFQLFLAGQKCLLPQSFLLTFDDGRQDSFRQADPVLKNLGFHAVMFVITKYSLASKPSDYYLNANDLKNMLASGRWDIQAHTKEGHDLVAVDSSGNKGHYYTNRLWLASQNRLETDAEYQSRVVSDLETAKKDLESRLGTTVTSLAFPFGDYGQVNPADAALMPYFLSEVSRIYPLSFYQVWPGEDFTSNTINPVSRLAKRVNINAQSTVASVKKILAGSSQKDLPYTTKFDTDTGLIAGWGQTKINQNSLEVFPFPDGTSAFILLDGSQTWSNYRYSLSVSSRRSHTLSLVARYRDSRNYLSCQFSGNSLYLQQVKDGRESTLFQYHHVSDPGQGQVEYSLTVDHGSLACYQNGINYAQTWKVDPSLDKGGIGLKIWDEAKGQANLQVVGLEAGNL